MQLDLLDTAAPEWTARPDSLTAAGATRAVKKPSRRHPIHRWFAKVNRGRVVHLQYTLTPESTLRQP
jgi:hypothetical protein